MATGVIAHGNKKGFPEIPENLLKSLILNSLLIRFADVSCEWPVGNCCLAGGPGVI